MRVFLDANVLFSAARSDGAVRELLRLLVEAGHSLVADGYVTAEATRNVSLKAPPAASADLAQLLTIVTVQVVQRRSAEEEVALLQWLHEKDRPVLMAAIALRCDALVTGDKTHFGSAYGRTYDGVTVYSPAMLAEKVLSVPD